MIHRSVELMLLAIGFGLGSASVRANSFDEVVQEVNKQVEANLRYPTKAIADHETGTVLVRVEIDRTGTVMATRLITKSGYVPLDAEARNVFDRIARFDLNIPDELFPDIKIFAFELPIMFQLPVTSASNKQAPALPPNTSNEPQIASPGKAN